MHMTTLHILENVFRLWRVQASPLLSVNMAPERLRREFTSGSLFLMDVGGRSPEEVRTVLEVAAHEDVGIAVLLPLTSWKRREQYVPPGCTRFMKMAKPAKRRELLRSLAELAESRAATIVAPGTQRPPTVPSNPWTARSSTGQPLTPLEELILNPDAPPPPDGSVFEAAAAVSQSRAAEGVHDVRISVATSRAIAQKAQGESFAAQHPASILIVEDQPLNQKISFMLLQRLGYTHIDVANNGQEAVEMVAKADYDIIFMDLQMPVMGGMDATAAIRKNFNLRRQPVIIAMTGHALTGVKEECQSVGMHGCLTKPVSIDDFRRTIPLAVGNGVLEPMAK
jgi:CheY-like chemotaxis protein